HNRFDAEGRTTDSYDFIGSFRPDDDTVTLLGHNLKDKMWPWDGTLGRVVVDRLGKGNRPSENPFPPFPKAPAPSLWPDAPTMPTPGDVIDYLGMAQGRKALGYCYDNVPYGIRPPSSGGPTPAHGPALLAANVLGEVVADNNSPY